MNVAEQLAREIRRVAGLRATYADGLRAVEEAGLPLTLVDGALEHACKAIGTGDTVAMQAAGLVLEGITL